MDSGAHKVCKNMRKPEDIDPTIYSLDSHAKGRSGKGEHLHDMPLPKLRDVQVQAPGKFRDGL